MTIVNTILFFLFASFFVMACQEHAELNIDQMTLEEKIDFVGGYKEYNIRGF